MKRFFVRNLKRFKWFIFFRVLRRKAKKLKSTDGYERRIVNSYTKKGKSVVVIEKKKIRE